MLSGVGGFVLGLLFLGAGLFIYFRNQKGKEHGGSPNSIAFQGKAMALFSGCHWPCDLRFHWILNATVCGYLI